MRACGWNMNQSKAEYPNIPNNVRMRMAHYSYVLSASLCQLSCHPLSASLGQPKCLFVWSEIYGIEGDVVMTHRNE